jgi:hypothetical protein
MSLKIRLDISTVDNIGSGSNHCNTYREGKNNIR